MVHAQIGAEAKLFPRFLIANRLHLRERQTGMVDFSYNIKCLPFRYGVLITLREMGAIIAAKMVHITARIEQLEKAALYFSSERGNVGDWDGEKQKLKRSLEEMHPMLNDLSLNSAKDFCEQLIREIEAFDIATVKSKSNELRGRLESDLKA